MNKHRLVIKIVSCRCSIHAVGALLFAGVMYIWSIEVRSKLLPEKVADGMLHT
jgi:hypothetical protein